MSVSVHANDDHPEALAGHPLFQQLPTSIIEQLGAIARPRSLNRGAALYNQSDLVHNVYFLTQGAVRLVQYTPDGNAVCLAVYAPGDLFALLEVMQGRPALGTTQALKATQLLAFPGALFRQLVTQHPTLSSSISQHLMTSLFGGFERIRELSTMKVEARLAHCLLRLVDKFGVDEASRWTIDVPLPRQTLAEIVGTRAETVSRILASWEAKQLVDCGREQINILDLPQFRAITC